MKLMVKGWYYHPDANAQTGYPLTEAGKSLLPLHNLFAKEVVREVMEFCFHPTGLDSDMYGLVWCVYFCHFPLVVAVKARS